MFTFNHPHPPVRSRRADQLARWLGLCAAASDSGAPVLSRAEALAIAPPPGRITLVTGPSGSGKSSLLRALRGALSPAEVRWIDLDEIELADLPLVDCFRRATLTAALKRLGRVGLAEAWTCLRTPRELSDGQRWRLKLALALHEAARGPARRCSSPGPILCADEFAATLDRVTAMIMSRALRRALQGSPRTSPGAVLATAHDDLIQAVQPDVIVRCDFGTVWIHPMRRGQLR